MSDRFDARLLAALPFWASILYLPLIALAAQHGTPWIIAFFVYGIGLTAIMDQVTGKNTDNADPQTADARLYWYRMITLIWLPIQVVLVLAILIWIRETDHLSTGEEIGLMLALGLVTGSVGIVYAHELIHQTNRMERGMGEALMIMVLYGHFVTEHLLVHHRDVATPRDAATARYNESIYAFIPRVLFCGFASAWRVEAGRLAQRDRPIWHTSNPFWRYLGGAFFVLLVAFGIGGWYGVGLYAVMSWAAILQLEQINYIEHYGLTRKRHADGRYEPVAPHHSWNADQKATSFLLINLQRHSDHHVKPARRFPLLQTYDPAEAPQLPVGYPLLALLTYNPWLWRRMMNPRVRKWRSLYYPEITDWRV